MEQKHVHTFHKSERLCGRRVMDALFAGGNKSLVSYPVRAVFMPMEEGEGKAVSVLVSVSKRHFKRAVKRNRVKRQIREAYRRHKHVLTGAMQEQNPNRRLALAFLWLSDRLYTSVEVDACIRLLLTRIAERMQTGFSEEASHD